MANILISEDQLRLLIQNNSEKINETHQDQDNKVLKQHLFVIKTIAEKLYDIIDDNQEVEDWVHSKIAIADETLSSVAKNILYGDKEGIKGMDNLDYNDLVIGK